MLARVFSGATVGLESVPVEMEVDISCPGIFVASLIFHYKVQINFEIALYLTIMYNIDNKGVNVLMA